MSVAKLKAEKKGDVVIIHKDSFELILTALASQKFVERDHYKAMKVTGKASRSKSIREIQKDIDDIYIQGMEILEGK